MSAMKAGMDRKTASQYLADPERLSRSRPVRTWRTRSDPLSAVWTEAQGRLQTAPELEAKALFEYLQMLYPQQVRAAQLRTFQRRVRAWRLARGPAPEVIFPQTHRPGEVMQLDWTHARELGVTIAGVPLDPLLCQAVLPSSNWPWATRCQSESLLPLRTGLQAALFGLGKAPQVLQTDNSSAATHQISGQGQREFNPEYWSLVAHYGISPRTIHVDSPNENGGVESHNRHLKRRLEQHLLLRGYRDFASERACDEFWAGVLTRANAQRTNKVSEELARRRELPPTRLCDYEELECQVSSHSTIRVRKVAYSVPSRHIGRRLRVRVYEQHLELYHGGQSLGQLPRVPGRGAVIDSRHVIAALLRKPGAFARYRYREELFLLAFGLPGRGKSHFVAALGRELILRHGYAVLFTPAFKRVQQLLAAKKALKLEALLKKLDRFAVAALDDIGYVQQDREEMEVLFAFLAERYERRSVMITSNLVFSKWDPIFKDPMTTMAAIDRLVHHATILEFDGESVRAQRAKTRAAP